MAAHPGRDQLRYTTDFPILQAYLNPNANLPPPPPHLAHSLGNLQQLMDAVSQLLEVAVQNGQQERIDALLEFQSQLDQIPERVYGALGRRVPYTEIELQIPKRDFNELAALAQPDHSGSASDDTSSSSVSGVDSGSDSDDSESEESCPICFDDVPVSEMRSLLSCGQHKYCQLCMDRHLSTLINDSQLKSLSCPFPGCPVVPAEYEIENLVSPDTYQKYLQFSAAASLQSEQGAKWCPGCSEAIVWDPNQKKVVCPACKHEFCFDCSKPPHEGRACNEVATAAAEAGDPDAQFQQWLKDKGVKVKPCPGCREGIEKNDGCNHMTCRQCGHQWCWLCLGRYEGGHFNQGLCEGLQFGAFDSIEEALADRGMSIEEARARAQEEAEAREREQREREEYERSPAGIAARRRREKEAKKRRRKRKAKKIAKYTALAPVVVVGGAVVGVVALGALAVIAPIALVGAAFN